MTEEQLDKMARAAHGLADPAPGMVAELIQEIRNARELLMRAWAVIANAGHKQGGWESQDQEWVECAEVWRDAWHKSQGISGEPRNDKANGEFKALPKSAWPPQWHGIGWNGVEMVYDEGDSTGAVVTCARVVQGGNGLWTPRVQQFEKGRPKKRSEGRTASRVIASRWTSQCETKEEAVAWCEAILRELANQE